MLMPKKTKYRKQQRGRNKGKATKGNYLAFGDFGISALINGTINSRQIEAARVTLNRTLKRGGKVWIRIFPDIPYTKKPAETRMGKGKGAPEGWIVKIKAGRILFEVGGVDSELAVEALNNAIQKLPIKATVVSRNSLYGEI